MNSNIIILMSEIISFTGFWLFWFISNSMIKENRRLTEVTYEMLNIIIAKIKIEKEKA